MKSTSIFSVALLVAGTAMATSVDVTSKACLAVMPVSSKQATVIISVPWVESGASSTNCISVTNFVLAANLTAAEFSGDADTLRWYGTTNSNPKSWFLKSNSTGVSYWEAVDDGIVDPVLSTAPVIQQGQALILTRHSPTNNNGTAKTFYLVGQVGTNATVLTEVPRKPANKNAVTTLIAPPSVATVNLNNTDEVVGWNNSCTNDEIIVDVVSGMQVKYTYKKDEGWKSPYGATATPSIGKGKGFWYVRRHADPLTITWKNPPKVDY